VDREELVCSLLLELEYIYEMANSNREDDLMELLRKLDCSRGRKIKIETENQKVLGVFQDYDSLTSVRVEITERSLVHLETGSVVFVEYLGA
jgi:biotin-(acetyl-CoA carboxylase) ligase